MSEREFRDKTAIVGIGYSRSPEAPGGFSKNSGESVLTLTVRAARQACSDAGIEPSELDGGLMFSMADSVGVPQVLAALGASDVRFSQNIDGAGNMNSMALGLMAQAVYHGIVKYGLVYRAMNGRSGMRTGQTGGGASNLAEGASQWTVPYGLAGPPSGFALTASRYLAMTGLKSEDFGAWSVFNRGHAINNPRATFRTPIALDDHQSSRWVIAPYHLLDCCLETDGAAAVIVASADVARRMKKRPVLISSVAQQVGGLDDPVATGFVKLGPRLLDAAGVSLSDVSIFETYDNFSDNPLRQIEDVGWCARGEAPAFIREGRGEYDGEVAISTHGGSMNEGYTNGFNAILEAVQQLRSEAEDLCSDWAEGEHTYDRLTCRQVKSPQVALHASVTGAAGLVLRRGE